MVPQKHWPDNDNYRNKEKVTINQKLQRKRHWQGVRTTTMQHKSSDFFKVSSFIILLLFFYQMRAAHSVEFCSIPTKSASARGTEPCSPILV